MGTAAGSSGVRTNPWFRPEAPAASSPRSISVTRAPRRLSSKAVAQPMIPPPTTTTSEPLRTGRKPTGAAGSRSAKSRDGSHGRVLERADRLGSDLDRYRELVVRDHERGAEHHDVPVRAVGTSRGRVEEDATLTGRGHHTLGDAFLSSERGLRLPVPHELDPDHQAQAPDVTGVRVIGQRLAQRAEQAFALLATGFDEVALAQPLQHGQPHGRADDVMGV